jgi:hypothetical protein
VTGPSGPSGPSGVGSQGPSGPSGAGAGRVSIVSTTTSLVNNTTATVTLSGFKTYALLKMQVDAASWVRLYTDAVSQSSDSGRLQGVDPTPGNGVLAEIISAGSLTQLISPAVIGFNADAPPSNNIYASVTNLSGSTRTITVTLTVVQLEL